MEKIIKYIWSLKGREIDSFLRKNPNIQTVIDNQTPFLKNYPILAKIYCIMHNITQLPLCAECGKQITRWNGSKREFSIYCSNLCGIKNKDRLEKSKQTNLKKYGVDNPSKSPLVKEKMKKTVFKKYGTDCSLKHKDINKKRKKTWNKKYNLGNPATNHISKDAYEKLNNPQWIITEHHINQRSLTDIGIELNTHYTTISNYCKKFNIEIKNYYQSMPEQSLISFLELLNISDIQTNIRNIIPPYELDIYLPHYKLAIEYCGLFWHSEQAGKDKWYHKRKYDLCKEKGIQLITIFEDEWLMKENQIKTLLTHKLGKQQHKIYARKTQPKKILIEEKKKFLNKFHIQGNGPSSINIGLFYHNTLVAVMCFISQHNNNFILNRYATSLHVVGGFSKLLKWFCSTYKWNTIISFSDNKFSNGNLYSINNWKLDKELKPDYYYIYNKKRYHKFNFRRKQLQKILNKTFNPDLSESQNCANNNIRRIWDCGKIRWIKRNI